MKIIWQTVRRITNKILRFKGLKSPMHWMASGSVVFSTVVWWSPDHGQPYCNNIHSADCFQHCSIVELGDIFSKEQTAEGETKWSGIWLGGCSYWSAPGDPFGSMAISGDDNDLRLPEGFHMWKFAADTTVSEVVPASKHSSLRQAADYDHDWSQENHLQLNPTKCKETRTWFKRTPPRYCSQWSC